MYCLVLLPGVIYCLVLPPCSAALLLKCDGLVLLQALLLADRFTIPEVCTAGISQALMAKMDADVSTEAFLRALCDLPETLLQAMEVSRVVAKCLKSIYHASCYARDGDIKLIDSCRVQEVLLKAFRHIPAIISSTERHSIIGSLPLPLIVMLAKSCQLMVHSENCVAALLSIWCESPRTYDKRYELVNKKLTECLRITQLSPSYLLSIVPHLSCFGFGTADCYRDALRMVQMEKCLAVSNDFKSPAAPVWPILPDGRKPARALIIREAPSVDWTLDESEVTKLLRGEALSSPDSIYSSGYIFRMFVRLKLKEENDAIVPVLSLYVRPDLGWLMTKLGITSSLPATFISLSATLSAVELPLGYKKSLSFSGVMMDFNRYARQGWEQFIEFDHLKGTSAPDKHKTLQEALAPDFTQHSRVTFRLEINNVQ